MSSLDNIMDAEETLTWVEQHVITATDWAARRMGRYERWEVDREGKAPALQPSTLKLTQESIEPGGKPDGTAFMPPYTGPTSRENPGVPMQGGQMKTRRGIIASDWADGKKMKPAGHQ